MFFLYICCYLNVSVKRPIFFFISATEQTSVFPLTKAQCDLWPLNGRPSRFFSILSQTLRYTSDITSLEEVLSQRWRPSYLVCFFGLSYPNMKTSSSAGGGPLDTWKKKVVKDTDRTNPGQTIPVFMCSGSFQSFLYLANKSRLYWNLHWSVIIFRQI